MKTKGNCRDGIGLLQIPIGQPIAAFCLFFDFIGEITEKVDACQCFQFLDGNGVIGGFCIFDFFVGMLCPKADGFVLAVFHAEYRHVKIFRHEQSGRCRRKELFGTVDGSGLDNVERISEKAVITPFVDGTFEFEP